MGRLLALGVREDLQLLHLRARGDTTPARTTGYGWASVRRAAINISALPMASLGLTMSSGCPRASATRSTTSRRSLGFLGSLSARRWTTHSSCCQALLRAFLPIRADDQDGRARQGRASATTPRWVTHTDSGGVRLTASTSAPIAQAPARCNVATRTSPEHRDRPGERTTRSHDAS